MERSSISFPVKRNDGPRCLSLSIIRFDRQRSVQRRSLLSIATQNGVAECELLEREEIARINLHRVLVIAQTFIVFALAAHDSGGQFENARIIGKSSARDLELSQRATVIAISTVQMLRSREMRVAGIRPQPECSIDRGFGRHALLRSVIPQTVQTIVGKRELALRGKEGGIAGEGLVEQIDS